jgi:hypothetical protein
MIMLDTNVRCGARRIEEAQELFDLSQAGVQVRHAHNPSEVGETTGDARFRAGRGVPTIRTRCTDKLPC